MGTSHRHTPTIQHQPNWGQTSAAVTDIATGVEKSDNLEKNPPAAMTPQQINSRQSKLDNQIRRNFHRAVRNLVRSAGGRGKVSSGISRAVGHAGVVVAGRFISTFTDIANRGLLQWMRAKGIMSLEGKSCRDILSIIRGFIQNGVSGLDNTAANEALEHVMEMVEGQMNDDVASFDDVMGKVWENEVIKDLIDEFFGMYIYSHLSQDFEEKLTYEKGSDVMLMTMAEIRELIIDDIKIGKLGRSPETIDWASEEGQIFIRKEFDRIIYILSGNED